MVGRPKGSKNKQRTPEQMAELRARKEQRRALKAAIKNRNGIGANVASLTDDQERALHFIHLGEYQKAEEAVKRAMASRKTAVARIKSEGGNIDQIKVSMALQTPEGEEHVLADIKRKTQAARWAGVGLQLDLFDQDRADAQAAYERGKTAGLQGLPYENEDQDWMTGYQAGQEALTATLDLFRPEPKQVEDKEPEPEGIPVIEHFQEDNPPWSENVGQEDLTEGETENLADQVEGAPV